MKTGLYGVEVDFAVLPRRRASRVPDFIAATAFARTDSIRSDTCSETTNQLEHIDRLCARTFVGRNSIFNMPQLS